MSEVHLDWVKEKTFVATDSTGHAIVVSAAGERDGVGVKPSDLLLLGLAACAAVDVVEILTKKRQLPDRMEVRVEGQQDADPPWAFRKIRLHFILHGEHLQAAAVEQAIRLSDTKYCSVAATIRETAEIATSYEIHPAPTITIA